jgi:D-serine deaminase-like pyridoxal phosphate-dependent protein
MHRTGIPTVEIDRIRGVARRAGGRFQGLHFYDGHVHESSAEGRRISAWRGYKTLVGLVEGVSSAARVNEVVTSGTPSFRYALDFEPFEGLAATHRVSPGTVVFHDLRTEQELDDLDLLPAAIVFTRVVSHPREGHFTCDAGSKSIAAEAGDPCAFVLGHPEAEALTPSEEHLPFSLTGNRPPRGEELYLVPRHVCPTVNLAEQALLVDGETISITRVEARAHDLLLDSP